MEGIYIIIPALEPEERLCSYVSELCRKIQGHIIVVDDGSGDRYQPIFDRIRAKQKCTVLTHSENKGKGRALKTAFGYVKEKGGKGSRIICVDSDGQHAAVDVFRILGKMCDEPKGVILGERDFSRGGIPFRSWIGNRVISLMFWLESGKWLRDTQTGLRAFDGEYLDVMLEVPGERFEYEMQALLTCIREKIPIRTERICTIYENGNAGSHFRPIRDSVRVVKVLCPTLFRFIFSSIFCTFLDLLLFCVSLQILKRTSLAVVLQITVATYVARAGSAVSNYILNRIGVFGCKDDGASFLRYLLLCLFLGAGSAAFVSAVTTFFSVNPVCGKILCDTILFFLSYRMQKSWVFQKGTRGNR